MEKILIVSHNTDIEGPAHKWISYLKRKKYSVTVILHPLFPKSNCKSKIEINGETINFKIFWLFQYFLEGLVSMVILRVKFKKNTHDLAICFDPLSFFHLFILKRFFLVKKIIYYNLDYSKQRFSNVLLNFIYQKINLFSYKNCNYFFSTTNRFLEDVDPKNKIKSKNRIFPISHTIRNLLGCLHIRKIPNSILYSGTLGSSVYFDDLFKALRKLKDEKEKFVFDIYGKGGQEEHIITLINKYKLKNWVHLRGIFDYDTLVDKIVPKYMIGVCPYNLRKSNDRADFIFTADNLTTKMVDYVGRGLPIISTKPYQFLEIIEKKRFGFLVKKITDWQKAISNLLNKDKLYQNFVKNALLFAQKYDDEAVLTPVLKKILSVDESTS